MESLAGMGLTGLDAVFWILLAVVPIASVLMLMPFWLKLARAKGWIGKDIHKTARPEVPESGGVVLFVGLVVGLLFVGLFYPQFTNEIWVLFAVVAIAAGIGFIDDRNRLSSLLKIGLVVVAGTPLLIANWFSFIQLGRPMLPVLGILQITILYPLATPIIIAVSTNTMNMLEGYNGEGAGTCVIVGIAMIIAGVIQDSAVAVIFAIPLVAATAGFLKFNKYPARVFPGDVGTLAMGAMIGGVMILGGIEVATFCALLAHVLNSFYVIISVRGLRESHNIRRKDIVVLEDDRIQASVEDGSPVTLPRLLLAYGELTERELVNQFWWLSGIAAVLGTVAAVVTIWTNTFTQDPLIIALYIAVLVVCVILFTVMVWKHSRLRSTSAIMIVLLLVGFSLLLIIDAYIIPLGSPQNIVYTGLIALPAFALWYFLQTRIFWRTLARYKVSFAKTPVSVPP